jgi:predicted amidohydrolase YtcJ
MKMSKVVDLALINGKIITMAGKNRIAEAVAIKGDRILEVGTTPQIKKLMTRGTQTINLRGKTVTPGFIESHCHAKEAGTQLVFEVPVKDADSVEEIIRRIRQKARTLPKAKWVIASGYDDQRLEEKRHPTRWDLDKASDGHPVFLRRLDGHLAVANSRALLLAHVTKGSSDPEGGEIDRVAGTGEPSGLLKECAQDLVTKIIPPYSIAEIKQAIQAACETLGAWGITSFTDALVTHDSFVAYHELVSEGKLPLRVGLLIPWLSILGEPGYRKELKALGIGAGFGNEQLRIVGTKFMLDGSMSGRTAALYQPYLNEPGNCGITILSKDELTEGVIEAHKAGLRPCIHAIGDKAIDVVLDAVEAALREKPARDHRIRIEHCSLPTARAVRRFKRLGVLPSSAVSFLYELGSAHLSMIGPRRIKQYFPHRQYIERDIVAVGHSDWPVTSANIAKQIYAAVIRKSYLRETIGCEQSISVMDALRLYTINAAYASFEENIKGSIEPGKLADMAVLDRDILKIPKEEIKDTKVEMTLVGGKIIQWKSTDSRHLDS